MEKIKVLETINKAEYKVRVSFYQNGVIKSFIVGPGEIYILSPQDVPANDTLLAISRGLCKIYDLKITTKENLKTYYKYDSSYFKTKFVYVNENTDLTLENTQEEINESEIDQENRSEEKELDVIEIKDEEQVKETESDKNPEEENTEDDQVETKPKKGRPKKQN